MDGTKPPTKMGKSDLIKALSDLGYEKEQLLDSEGKGLKRPALLEMLQSHRQGEEGLAVLSEVKEEDDVGVAIEDVQDVKKEGGDESDDQVITEIPIMNDPGWTQYVLGKFEDDETDKGNPRVEGLRRIAGELVGELIEEGCDLVAAPTEENGFRACVKAWGVFNTDTGLQKRFEALADANSDNCVEAYSTYLVAMADTRAKGRVFRNALGLRRVVAAEEVSTTLAMSSDVQKDGHIHTGQISMLRMMSERQGVKISEVLDELKIPYELNDKTGDVNLQSITYDDAVAAGKKIREMKEEKEKE